MPRPVLIEDRVTIAVTVSKKFKQHMKKECARISSEAGTLIPLSELIRGTLEQVYPMKKELEKSDLNQMSFIDVKKPE